MILYKIKSWLYEGNRLERIWLLSKIEFKLRYYGNRLGLIWALINPLSRIAMFYVMFILIMGGDKENFVVYLFSGFIIWIFFMDVTNRSMIILKAKRQLYEHTDIDKTEIYMSLIVSSTIGLLFNFCIFSIVAFISGVIPSWHYIFFPFIYLNLTILCMGIALILSNLFILFTDITQIWNIATTVLFFLSPILFRGDVIANNVPIINYANPLSGIINNTRNILLEEKLPDWSMLAFNYSYAIILLMIGIYLLKTISPKSSELV